MKRGALFLLLLLVIPFVSSAENEILFSKSHVQLGDSFSITGQNIKLNGNLFTGNSMIILDNGANKYTLLAHISNGNFQQDAAFCKTGCVLPNQAGEYKVIVSLLDSSLLELGKIELADSLIVDSEYNVVAQLSEMQIDPGDKIEIIGSVQRNSDSALLSQGEIKILFDGVEYKTNILNQEFIYELNTAFDMKSGYHNIVVSTFDEDGNLGNITLQCFVIAIPSSLTMSIEKDSYLPKESVKLSLSLLDQANDPIAETVKLNIYDSKNKRILDEVVSSNQDYIFELPEYTVPGEWLAIIKFNTLKDQKSFVVETIETLDIKVNGQYLDVVNTGNIKYVNNLEIFVEPDNFTSLRRTNINPGESITIRLNTLLDEGEHQITIKNFDQTFSVNVVDDRNFGGKLSDYFFSLTGQAVKKPGSGTSSAPTVIMVILALFVIMAGYTVYKGYKSKNINRVKFKEPKTSKLDEEDLAVVKKNDVVDIRDRILKNLKESKKTKKEEKLNSSEIVPLKPKPVEEEVKKVDFDQPMRKRSNEQKGEDGWTYF
nr:hypothetical protein [Nanoarchaeum sp.]